MPRLSKRHGVLAGLLLLGLMRGGFYAITVPPWQHPDEPTHFEHARYIAVTGQWPAWADVNLPLRQMIADSMRRFNFWRDPPPDPFDPAALAAPGISLIGISTAAQPRLYYLLAALWLQPVLNFPVETQLYALRLLSVVLNLAALMCIYAAASEFFSGNFQLTMSASVFVLFQPMYTDIMSAVNNDVLINTLGCALFWVFARLYRRGWGWGRALAVGGLTLLAVLTKTTAVALVGAFIFSIGLYPWPERTQKMLKLGLSVLALGGVVLIVAVFLLGRHTPLTTGLVTLIERYFRVNWEGTLTTMFSPQALMRFIGTARIVFKSFWAAFGWRNVLLPPNWYWAPGLATLLALFGLARAWFLKRHLYPAWQIRFAGLALATVLLAWAITVLRSLAEQGSANVYYSHGRYAFVALAPFALLFTAGLLQWVPRAWRRWGVGVYIVSLALFEASCFWGVLVPYYY